MSQDQDLLIKGHEYDGIKELDNPLPAWWLFTFLITIIFSFLYWIHYDLTATGPSTSAELEMELSQLQALHSAATSKEPSVDLQSLVKNSKALEVGQGVFAARCAVCHGAKAEGQIGPNLTDRFWIHGKGTPEDILQVVSKGVLEKGMPSWESMLSATEIQSVSVYVFTLKNSNPPNAKAPDGTEIKE